MLATSLYEVNKNNIVHFPIKEKAVRLNGTVQPIKNKEDIARAKSYLHDSTSRYSNSNLNLRNYCLFVLGLNLGRRIGDLLEFKIADVLDKDQNIKDKIILLEEKTKKKATVFLNDNAKKAIDEYLNSLKDISYNDYLFKSRNGNNKPITSKMAWRIISDMGKALGLKVNLGTHSMRKTFGYQYVKDNKNDSYAVAKLSKAFNHSSEEVTYHYLGFDEEEMEKLYKNNNL